MECSKKNDGFFNGIIYMEREGVSKNLKNGR